MERADRRKVVRFLKKRREQYWHTMPRVNPPAHTLGTGTFFPTREVMMQSLGHKTRVAELGVAQGDFSDLLLSALTPKELVLVDAWHSAQYSTSELRVRERFADTPSVNIQKGFSTDILETFEDAYFDLIYIDTVHDYEVTRKELDIAARKTARDGYIAGHDFCTGSAVGGSVYGVIPAVTEFLSASDFNFVGLSLEAHGHFSFLLKR